MRPTPHSLTISLILTCAAPLCIQGDIGAQEGIAGTLIHKDGRRERGVEILAMSLDKITYRRDGREVETPSYLVASVQWTEPPAEFGLAEAEIARGEFANAAELYREAAGKTNKEPLKLEALFLAADALVQAASTDASKAGAAEAALQQLLQDHPTTFRVPDAKLNLGQVLRFAGKAIESEELLRQVEDEALRGNWAAVWGARAKYQRALAQLDQGKAPEARNSFRAAASAANAASATGSRDPDLTVIKMRALVGEGETFVHEKNYSQALIFFRGLAASAPPSPNTTVAAAAKAGEGEALFLQAAASNDIPGLRRAQLALAEASLLDSDGGDTSAKSCYYMALTILALGSAGESETFKARATAYLHAPLRPVPGADAP